MTKNKKARLDADGNAQPLTRIVHHPVLNGACIGPGEKLYNPELEDESGHRTPLTETKK